MAIFRGLLMVFFALNLLYACSKKRVASVNQTPPIPNGDVNPIFKASDSEPQILFIQLKVVKSDDNTEYAATIVDKKVVKGQLDKSFKAIQLLEGYWLISLLDAEQKVLSQELIVDPVNQRFEYTNDKGNLQQTEIVKKEADFFVRVQYTQQLQFLKCEAILADKQMKKLFQLKL